MTTITTARTFRCPKCGGRNYTRRVQFGNPKDLLICNCDAQGNLRRTVRVPGGTADHDNAPPMCGWKGEEA